MLIAVFITEMVILHKYGKTVAMPPRYRFFAHFVAVLCKTTMLNDQVLRVFKNVGHDGKYFEFRFGIDCWHYMFSLNKFLDGFTQWKGFR